MPKSKSVYIFFFQEKRFKKMCMNIFLTIISFRERIKEFKNTFCMCGPHPCPLPPHLSQTPSLAARGRPDRGGQRGLTRAPLGVYPKGSGSSPGSTPVFTPLFSCSALPTITGQYAAMIDLLEPGVTPSWSWKCNIIIY